MPRRRAAATMTNTILLPPRVLFDDPEHPNHAAATRPRVAMRYVIRAVRGVHEERACCARLRCRDYLPFD